MVLTDLYRSPLLTSSKDLAPQNTPPPTNSKSRDALSQFLADSEKSRRKVVQRIGTTIVTRRIYPRLVELKIAGHTDQQIAKRFGTDELRLKAHIARAMTAYRNGDLHINGGEAVEEARHLGEEKSTTVEGSSTEINIVA